MGDWNFEHVIVKGHAIKLELGATTVVDADVSHFNPEDGSHFMHGSKHPGLLRTKGCRPRANIAARRDIEAAVRRGVAHSAGPVRRREIEGYIPTWPDKDRRSLVGTAPAGGHFTRTLDAGPDHCSARYATYSSRRTTIYCEGSFIEL